MCHAICMHWGRVTHICVGKLTIIGQDNGLSPVRRQAIIWTNAGILLIGPLRTNFSEIVIEIHTFSFKKMHLKMSSGKWQPFCLCFNELTKHRNWQHTTPYYTSGYLHHWIVSEGIYANDTVIKTTNWSLPIAYTTSTMIHKGTEVHSVKIWIGRGCNYNIILVTYPILVIYSSHIFVVLAYSNDNLVTVSLRVISISYSFCPYRDLICCHRYL